MTRLTDLKELSLSFASSEHIETVAKSLTKLELLSLVSTKIKVILTFMRHSKKLKTIKFLRLSEKVLDAFALSQERKEFENMCPVAIYMPDDIYLPTKWKSRNSNLDLVRIMRLNTRSRLSNNSSYNGSKMVNIDTKKYVWNWFYQIYVNRIYRIQWPIQQQQHVLRSPRNQQVLMQ